MIYAVVQKIGHSIVIETAIVCFFAMVCVAKMCYVLRYFVDNNGMLAPGLHWFLFECFLTHSTHIKCHRV